jgi:hypothetical protein
MSSASLPYCTPITNKPHCEDYPHVKYWTIESYRLKKKDADTLKTLADDGDPKNALKPCRQLQFITFEDGHPINNKEATSIRQTARNIWNTLAAYSCAPNTWSGTNIPSIEYYRNTIYKIHPVLSLAEGFWKVDCLATMGYPSWMRNHKFYEASPSSTAVSGLIESEASECKDDNAESLHGHGCKRAGVETTESDRPVKQKRLEITFDCHVASSSLLLIYLANVEY